MISSSTEDIDLLVKEGLFSEALYYRLKTVAIIVPPLSERIEDMPELVDYYVEQLSQTAGLPKLKFSKEVVNALSCYDFRGNLQQLKNVIELTLLTVPSGYRAQITKDMLPESITGLTVIDSASKQAENKINMLNITLKEARDAFEKEYLTLQLRKFNNNIAKTAAFIGMERSALHRKLKDLYLYK